MKIPFSDAAYESMISGLFLRFPSFGVVGAGAYKPGLDGMREMCRRMGNPQDTLRCVHVAGTNGKGSTCNMLAAHFAAKGLKTGLYTSPHIQDFRERIRLVDVREKGGVTLISRQKVWDFIARYEADIEELNLSFFEITTAMAFCFFAASGVDIAVIETGLGGRLDATNVIIPELSVITNIGYDHMDLLGSTLEEIAIEKAGIIKPGVPVVIGEAGCGTDPVFIRVASENNSPIFFADGPIAVQSGHGDTVPLPEMDLKGIYQAKNVNTVLCALKTLGQEPDMGAICNAAHICDFHGRWERICNNPATIIDIGHNQHGLKYNFKQLNDLLDTDSCTDLVMVYGSVKDKDVDAVLKILPRRAHVIFTAADNHRAMPAAELFRRAAHPSSECAAGVKEAVGKALALCSTMARPLLYIGGSTYVVSEAVPLFK